MYIRQECLFPFDEILKFQPESRLQAVLAQLYFEKLAEGLAKPEHTRGPKGRDPLPLLYSLIAMQLEKMKNISGLVQRLKTDPVFRYNCGFNVLEAPPSESTFSRFLNKISNSQELEDAFRSMVVKAKELGIIDGDKAAIDSSELNAFEKAKPSRKIPQDGISPNWGKKKDTAGNDHKWFGWKIHILSDCKSELPLTMKITPANVNDSIEAVPLIKQLQSEYCQDTQSLRL